MILSGTCVFHLSLNNIVSDHQTHTHLYAFKNSVLLLYQNHDGYLADLPLMLTTM